MPQRSRVLPSCFHFSTKRTKRMLGVVMRRILWKGFSHLFNSSWDLWKGMLLYYSIIQKREQEFHEGIFSVESRLIVPNSNRTWFGTWLKMYLAFILLDWNEWNLTILVWYMYVSCWTWLVRVFRTIKLELSYYKELWRHILETGSIVIVILLFKYWQNICMILEYIFHDLVKVLINMKICIWLLMNSFIHMFQICKEFGRNV